VAANKHTSHATLRLVSEFAAVEIERDDHGNGLRLMIRDTQSGNCVFLDPLELAALASTRHEDLMPLLDPARFERRGAAQREPDITKMTEP
jgi:hypothetical protein